MTKTEHDAVLVAFKAVTQALSRLQDDDDAKMRVLQSVALLHGFRFKFLEDSK